MGVFQLANGVETSLLLDQFLGNKAVKFHQSIMASGLQIPGTRGRVSVILLFVNLMTMSSEGHGTTVQSYRNCHWLLDERQLDS
ncbi:hypothetical protein DY000_02037544 [Brassica cretica]|uniref:Uncharacterized protein n=1 Tax=Brassica cretica TaxID=69181 RepID=A0ABQ7BFK3_BRACR|nr:hypothetical protein DY000_02037544 [Brassica cretica]